MSENAARKDLRIAIVGAGMAGILMAHRLRLRGFRNITLYEKGASVGGTWRENNYPGIACDVPSHHYCYSFAPNPGWSRAYSPGREIWRYFDRTARRLGIHPLIRFNTEVADARWQNDRWSITLKDGGSDQADVLVTATGVLHQLSLPDIPGMETFEGHIFHTARWDNSIPLRDKRIGIIGTGSTAVQMVAELGGKVRKLTLFQRTAQWVAQAPNPSFSWWQRLMFALFPSRSRKLYQDGMAITNAVVDGLMGTNEEARAALKKNVEDNLATVRDPELRARLTPDHEVGCKRVIMSPNFYEAIQDPAVELITDRIEKITPNGILTVDGRLHELDIIALATGFNPAAYMRPMHIAGRDGIPLESVWAERPIAYRALAIPRMPNYFMIAGPYSPFNNISNIVLAEIQTDYIADCIRMIADRNVAISPRFDKTIAEVNELREIGKASIYATGGCKSYYLDADGIPIVYPLPFSHYQGKIEQGVDLDDFEIEKLGRVEQPVPATA